MKKNKKGFTLIELIAVLVIIAIIALVVTPLVMNIVKKAKDSANKRSVEAYGKAVELAVATHLLDTGDYPTTLDNLTVEYSGNEVVCNIKTLNEDGSIYLSECRVKGTEVKDKNTEDGWYHYGKSSATAYQSYSVGDLITYNGMNFYVIENSDEKSDRVTLLKAEPLTVDEVNKYGGVGTDNNHVNMYDLPTRLHYQTAADVRGYGGIQYYSSKTCGYFDETWVYDGCRVDYGSSEIKYVVDVWGENNLNLTDLTEDSLGYKIRLITKEEYVKNSETTQVVTTSGTYAEYIPLYSWMYSSNYTYWTMSAYEDSNTSVAIVYSNGNLSETNVNSNYYAGDLARYGTIRPVIILLKSAL